MLDQRPLLQAETVIPDLPDLGRGASAHGVKNILTDACVRAGDDAPLGTIPVLRQRMAVATDTPNITSADRAHRF